MSVNKKIKRLRLNKGLTLDKLADLTKLTKGYLSKIENSDQAPPVSTLQTLALALGVEIGNLIDTGQSATVNLDFIKAKDTDNAPDIVSNAGYSYRHLVQCSKNKYMSPFLLKIAKGQTEVFSHDAEEFIYIIAGQVEFEYEGQTYLCLPGDSLYFDSRLPHKFTNNHPKQAVLITVNYNYRRY